MRRFILAAAAMLNVTIATLAWGVEPPKSADWPKWLGPNGDGISRETGLLDKWPTTGPDRLWAVTAGLGYSSPIAVDGKIYLFSTANGKDTLACLEAETGKEVWAQASDRGHNAKDLPGTRATPNIEGDFIYTFGGTGDLICRKLKDGQQVWMLDVLKETGGKLLHWGMASCPVISGELVYVQGGAGGAVAVAVDKQSGKLAWKSEAESSPKQSAGYAAVLPLESNGVKQVVVFTSWTVIGMDAATGKTLWQMPWATPPYNLHCTIPVYRDNQLFVTSGYGRGCTMLKLDGAKATPAWEQKEPHDRFTPPVLDGDALFVPNEEDTLVCLQWPTDKELWRKKLGIGLGGGFVRVGDKLIMLADSGKLLLVKATAKECELLSSVSLFKPTKEKDCWTTPLVYRGRLYVKGPADLVCFDIKAK